MGTVIASITNQFFNGETSSPSSTMYAMALLLLLVQLNYWCYWGIKNYDHLGLDKLNEYKNAEELKT